MKIIELTEQDKRAYNNFVMGQESGSFLQSWEWGQWQEALGRPVCRLKIAGERYDWMGAVQLVKVPLPFGQHYLYAPYGPVIGSGWQPGSLTFLQELERRFPKAIFIRTEPKKGLPGSVGPGPHIRKSSNIQPGKTLVLGLQKTEEELLQEMHRKTRYNIRLAARHGVEVISALAVVPGHGLYLEEALQLIMATARRQGYRGYPKEYYQKFLDFFGTKNHKSALQVYVYRALFKKQLLAAAVMVDFGQTRTYLFGGSSDSHREVMAPHLLHFTAIKDAKAKGMVFYDFWGLETAGGETAGFVRFKQGFGGNVVEYPGAYDYACKPFSYRLYKGFRLANRLVGRRANQRAGRQAGKNISI